jgi:hypothetical protein
MSDDFPDPSCSRNKCRTKINSSRRCLNAPSLQEEFGVYGEYMVYEVKDHVEGHTGSAREALGGMSN